MSLEKFRANTGDYMATDGFQAGTRGLSFLPDAYENLTYGTNLRLVSFTEEITSAATAAGYAYGKHIIPTGSIVLHATGIVTQLATAAGGAITLDVGFIEADDLDDYTGGDKDAIADGIDEAVGTKFNAITDGNSGAVWPFEVNYAGGLRVSLDAEGNDPDTTLGKVRVTVWYLTVDEPSS